MLIRPLKQSILTKIYSNKRIMSQQQLALENIKNIIKIIPTEKVQFQEDLLTITIKASFLKYTLLVLKNHINYQFKVLTCISGADHPSKRYRFKIVYELTSIRYNKRLRIKLQINELLSVDSCDKLFSASGWHECEIWDMFGVFFKNHTNLKRILTDYGFEGYPLRKDFPLSGFIEMRYNDRQKRVINESTEFCQEYRTFSFLSPWVKMSV